MLTKQQKILLNYIEDRLEKDNISPSYDEMKDALGLKSKSGIHRLIKALEERGFIKRLQHKARALEILRSADHIASPSSANQPTSQIDEYRMTEIPLHGRIAAGTPIEALEESDSHILAPANMLGPKQGYALQISGDSMVDKGILDGDIVIIEKCTSANDGDIVVALIDDYEATLKILQKKGKHIALIPANRDYETQIFDHTQVKVQGRLSGLVRYY